ncbi:sigma-70 family RNA polymerase sigma factor [Streptomyces fuscichromogenes]|uniref:sigma-70 family RNA polymerase sigma factor n=1 Tax=Streptomyces fuscichromogenes TaxID=1324013 RepID=UPI0037F32788
MTSSRVMDRPQLLASRNVPATRQQEEERTSRTYSSVRGDAFARTLYEEHGAVLLHFATRLCNGDRHYAEDIVQETAVRAWRHQGMLDPASDQVRSWLFTVIRNLVIDHHRARQSRPTEISEMELMDLSMPDMTEQTVALWMVGEAMADLSDQQRQILIRMYYLGDSVAQTSRDLGIPPGTVKSRAYYAVRALREKLRGRGVLA